jgi:long-chain acyl-CoA synthetase
MDSLTIDGLVGHHARYRPHARAFAFADDWWTWRELDALVDRTARGLRDAGVGHGDRVVTVLANCPEMIAIYWACARMGACAVPLSPLLTASGLATLIGDARPRVVVHSAATAEETLAGCADLATTCVQTGPAWHALVADAGADPIAARVQPDDLFNIMYTSGTTGMPKGIALTHRIRAHYAALLASAWRMSAASVVLHTGAMVFNGAFVTLMPALLTGAAYIVHPQFDVAAFLRTVERERVTHVMLVPSQIAAILESPGFDAARLTSLEVLVSLGAPLPLAHKDRLEQVLPGRMHELYGLTEGFVTILDRADAVRKRGSVGVPPPFFDLRIVDESRRPLPVGEIGEIAGKGPFLMSGYYGKPELTARTIQDGWLHTGDLGRVDEDGFLYLVDRLKDMIDSGGVKIYPHDIEEVIARHPQVAEAVVFGVPDDKWGETPLAAVRLRPGEVIGAEELRAWINANVGARYQRVSQVVLVDDFPRSVAGKILKRSLRDPYWAGRDRAI